jgi:hypothetical protein
MTLDTFTVIKATLDIVGIIRNPMIIMVTVVYEKSDRDSLYLMKSNCSHMDI